MTSPSYISDHLPLSITLFKNNLFTQFLNAFLKQHKITKQTFLYNKTSFLHWNLFSDKADLMLKQNTLYAEGTAYDFGRSRNTINAAWEFFTSTVMTAAKKHLPKQTSTNQHKTLYSH